jgi:hypothetical protein
LIQRAGKRFENTLGHVVGIATGQDIHMQIHAGMHRKRPQEVLDQLKLESASNG